MRFLGIKIQLLLFILYILALLYGTLWPFHFAWHPSRDTTIVFNQVEWVPFSTLCPTHGIFCPRDTGLNFVIFVPFGVLVTLLSGAPHGMMWRTAHAGILGFCLSLLIESSQYFIPARFPSTTDLLLNTLGAGLGGLMIASLFRRNRFNKSRP